MTQDCNERQASVILGPVLFSNTYANTFAYAYDKVGNRTAQTQTITSTLVTTYTYNAANRLTGAGGVAYTWDANGNLKNDGSKVYTYTQANQLSAITASGLTWSAAYNGDGARLKQTINSVPTTYTLDLAAPLVTVLAERTGATTKQYLYGQGDSPLAGYDGTTWTYLSGRDGLNSVRQETDASGNVITARGFDPYGVPLNGNGGAPFGYTGEQTDSTGLVFLRARYMQPTLGVFLSRDPWDGDELQPLTYNGWMYVEGNPVKYTDPSGLIAQGIETNEAEGIVNELKPYGITIVKDWGMRSPGMGCSDTWYAGNWQIGDLRLVREAIHLFDSADKFGTGAQGSGAARFSRAIQGRAKILRWNNNGLTSSAPPNGWPADVILTNNTFTGGPHPEYAIHTVIHELGHVWDFRTGTALSFGLMNALGTWFSNGMGSSGGWDPYANAEVPPGAAVGCTVAQIARHAPGCDVPYAFTYGGGGAFEGPGWEDWADSFAAYIYPAYNPARGWTNLKLSPTRENYVRDRINRVR